MSEEMAVGDNAIGEEAKVNGEELAAASARDATDTSSEQRGDFATQQAEETPETKEGW